MQPNNLLGGPDTRNLILSLVLATAIMAGWQYFYVRPQQEVARAAAVQMAKEQAKAKEVAAQLEAQAAQNPAETLPPVPSIPVSGKGVHGHLSLRGARLDDLTLADYRETTKKNAPEVALLNPEHAPLPYIIETGFLPADPQMPVPDASTVWRSQDTKLTPKHPLRLTWENGHGLEFTKTITLLDQYLFRVEMQVKNTNAAPVTLYPYGLISRAHPTDAKHEQFMHEGPLGVFNDVLENAHYKDLRKEPTQTFSASKGWIGVGDKYWLTAIIPDASAVFDAKFTYHPPALAKDAPRYQADLRGAPLIVPAQGKTTHSVLVFAGAKELATLDRYRMQYNIPLFDRAIDFGSLYFLTKPIFLLLKFFHALVGNFGVAILLLTIVIKALLYPLAHKSMVSMARMKQLAPQMTQIKERWDHDKMKMNQEIMAMYKREGVNPMGGCLPILLQLPVFLALYRVLSVTIEMRQASFVAWIKDLSVVDPTNLFNLFGLIAWTPPSMLHIGVLPLIMCATMVIQQKVNPAPTDPVQAKVMAWMPYLFLFMFANFPAGLVLYWAWNNVLSIVQQMYINTHLEKRGLK